MTPFARFICAAISICLSFVVAAEAASCTAYDKVDTFISTGGPGFGYGAVNPAAQYPLSPLRVGPDTTSSPIDINYQHFSGYLYYDKIMRAFSHTHVVGAGAVDLGTIGLMPYYRGQNRHENDSSRRFFWSEFEKDSEKGSPGRYEVFLDEPQAHVKLLAVGTHSAVHKYTWAKSVLDGFVANPGFVLDMCHSARMGEGLITKSRCENATVSVDLENPNTFSGSVFFDGSLSGHAFYYIHGEVSTNIPNYGVKSWHTCTTFAPDGSCSDSFATTESNTGVLFSTFALGFEDRSDIASPSDGADALEVYIKVGLSWISPAQAELNMKEAVTADDDGETPLGYAELEDRTVSAWCDVLDFLDVAAIDGDDTMETMLYSASYRTLLSPSRYNEAGGVYLGTDGAVHNATAERIQQYGDSTETSPFSYAYYSDLSTWDTFRTQHPWLLLTNEDVAVGIARSTADMTSQMGAFPRWIMANHESGCMIGEHGAAMVVEAVKAGFGDQIDVLTIQKALLLQSTETVPLNGRTDIEHYMSAGYVSSESSDTATTATLSYVYDDFVLAELCGITGDKGCAREALLRSKNYKNIWSRTRKIFCPKNIAGELDCPISPVGPESWQAYKEGNALHYMWYPAMHDVNGLIELIGSPEEFDATLSEYFDKHLEHEPLKSGLPNPYYWAGNEHQFHVPFLFNFGPNCTRTQYWSREITHKHFAAESWGSPGNDDYGSMSSWLAFASIGIFPQAGTTTFLIGSPRVQEATINMKHFDGSQSAISIKTINNSALNVYVQKLLVNGQEYTQPFIDRSVLAAPEGVTLEFYMQAEATSGLCV